MAKQNELLTIYGAKVSKDGKKVILTLVKGHDADKEFYSACVKLDNSGKVKAKVDAKNKVAKFQVNLLTPSKKSEDALDNDDF